MPVRIDELIQQRKAIAEHLAWLDREIAQAGATPAPSQPPAAPHDPFPTQQTDSREKVPAAVVLPPETELTASIILQEYGHSSGNPAGDARRGCIMVFVGSMILMFAIAIAAYFVYKQRNEKADMSSGPLEQRSAPGAAKPSSPPPKK